jgi:hypothetical protein
MEVRMAVLVDFGKTREGRQMVEYAFGFPEMNRRMVIETATQPGTLLISIRDGRSGGCWTNSTPSIGTYWSGQPPRVWLVRTWSCRTFTGPSSMRTAPGRGRDLWISSIERKVSPPSLASSWPSILLTELIRIPSSRA